MKIRNTNITLPVLLVLVFTGLFLSVVGSGIKTSFNEPAEPWLVNVNGHYITEKEFSVNKRKLNNQLPDSQVLSLMIDNILLVQRAEELGLIDSDRVVKKAIVHSVVESTVRNAIAKEPIHEQLMAFYNDNRNMFMSPKSVQLKFATLADANCQASNQLSGVIPNANWLAAEISHPASQGPMTQALLNRQFGPSLSEQIINSHHGDYINQPQDDASCFSIYVSQTQDPILNEFDAIRSRIRGEYRTQARRSALTNLLDVLKQENKILLSDRVQGDINE